MSHCHPSFLQKALRLTPLGTSVAWCITTSVGTTLILPQRKQQVPVHSSWIQPSSAPPTVLPFVPTVYKEAKMSSVAIPDPILLRTGGEVRGCGTEDQLQLNTQFRRAGPHIAPWPWF